MTTRPALPTDDCALEGPCGFCATLTRAARAALAAALAEGSPSAAEKASNSSGDEVADCSGSDVPEPGVAESPGGLDELFASLVGQMLGDLDGDTRRLEAEMAKRDQVYILAFQQVQAAVKEVAEVVRPLFDLPGVEVEDIKAVLNGAVQSLHFTWLEAHPERRRLHDQ